MDTIMENKKGKLGKLLLTGGLEGIRGTPIRYNYQSSTSSNCSALAILSPRVTEILIDGCEALSFLGSSVALKLNFLTAQKNNKLRALTVLKQMSMPPVPSIVRNRIGG